MKKYLSFATATAVVLGCTACSSSPNRLPRGPLSASVAAPSMSSETTSVMSKASGFCDLARRVGKSDLSVSAGNLDPDPKKLLTQVDQLDALAPPELRKDFDVFAGFEHSVLDPGTAVPPSTVRGDSTTALEHVSRYFVTVCKIR